jgi:hypothetical protein
MYHWLAGWDCCRFWQVGENDKRKKILRKKYIFGKVINHRFLCLYGQPTFLTGMINLLVSGMLRVVIE